MCTERSQFVFDNVHDHRILQTSIVTNDSLKFKQLGYCCSKCLIL